MMAQWIEAALTDVQYEKTSPKLFVIILFVLMISAASIYFLLNSAA